MLTQSVPGEKTPDTVEENLFSDSESITNPHVRAALDNMMRANDAEEGSDDFNSFMSRLG